MAEYIEREAVMQKFADHVKRSNNSDFAPAPTWNQAVQIVEDFPAADVVEEENILKFYYVRSIDEYWVGRRIDNFYYAEYDPKSHQWVWTHSRYLPWGEHVVSPTSLWKEHTYPSEPEEIPFEEWLQGFIKRYAADVAPIKHAKWIDKSSKKLIFGRVLRDRIVQCDQCRNYLDMDGVNGGRGDANYCPNCGARMDAKS